MSHNFAQFPGYWSDMLHTDEGNVIFHIVARETRVVFNTSKGRNPRENGVCLQKGQLGTQATLQLWRLYLRPAVTGQGIVPQILKRAFNWLLVVVMVAMCHYGSGEAENSTGELHID